MIRNQCCGIYPVSFFYHWNGILKSWDLGVGTTWIEHQFQNLSYILRTYWRVSTTLLWNFRTKILQRFLIPVPVPVPVLHDTTFYSWILSLCKVQSVSTYRIPSYLKPFSLALLTASSTRDHWSLRYQYYVMINESIPNVLPRLIVKLQKTDPVLRLL